MHRARHIGGAILVLSTGILGEIPRFGGYPIYPGKCLSLIYLTGPKRKNMGYPYDIHMISMDIYIYEIHQQI